MNIIFVCTGNTCRSPIAEGYLNSKNISYINCISRGLSADGSPVSDNAKKAMQKIGIDISSHLSRQLTEEDVETADRLICLSPSHLQYLLSAGVKENKLFLLGDGIPDPYGLDETAYINCRDHIISAIDQLFQDGFFNEYHIVPLERQHIAAIAKLEAICFSDPWSLDGITESYIHGTKFFVAQSDSRVYGYIGINAVVDEGYITNVAVFPKYRKKGVATALLQQVFDFAEQNELAFVSLEVRPSNTDAISLYEKNGFKTVGERRDFYRNPRENALIMTKRSDDTNENTQH